MNECRCDESLKTKAEKSTRFTYTGLLGELEHLKDKVEVNRREVWKCVGCVLEVISYMIGAPSRLRLIR